MYSSSSLPPTPPSTSTSITWCCRARVIVAYCTYVDVDVAEVDVVPSMRAATSPEGRGRDDGIHTPGHGIDPIKSSSSAPNVSITP